MIDLTKGLALLLLICLIIYASYKTISYAQRNLGSLIHIRSIRLIARASLIIVGGIAGFLLSLITLRISNDHAIVGLPLPWAIWENVNGHWEDFASPFSIVPWSIDLVFGLTLSHLPMAAVCAVRKSRRITSGSV